jgi:hypothetical protein
MKLYPGHWTLSCTMTIGTSVACFAGRSGSVQGQSSSLIRGSAGSCSGGGPRGDQEVTPEVASRRRFLGWSHPDNRHVLGHDWWGIEILVNVKGSH